MNGITIHADGESTFIQLTEEDASSVRVLASMVALDRKEQTAAKQIEPDGNTIRYQQPDLSSAELLQRISELEARDRGMVIALLETIRFGC